jgi:hypothetical protein
MYNKMYESRKAKTTEFNLEWMEYSPPNLIGIGSEEAKHINHVLARRIR